MKVDNMPFVKKPAIYVASRFSRKDEMRMYCDTLKDQGFEVVATWVYGSEDGMSREDIAALDYTDLMKADVTIVFTDPYESLQKGGARHSEMAFAYMAGQRVILVGEREQVFHHLPRSDMFMVNDSWNFTRETARNHEILERVDTFDEALKLLENFVVLDYEAEWAKNANRE